MKERRKRAKSIQAEIKRVLWEEWDPIGVRGEAPDDEYNAYIGGIHGLLARGADKDALVEHLLRLETEVIGAGGDPTRLDAVAESLLKIDIKLSSSKGNTSDTSTEASDLTIRPAEAADLPAIVRLLADDPLGAKRERVADPLPACYTEAFAAIEADPRNEVVVVLRDSDVVGCLQLTFIPGLSRQGAERAQIESVRVARGERGQGLGRILFEWAIDEARTRGCFLVQLTTDKSRPDAHRFYESLGFVASHDGMKLAL